MTGGQQDAYATFRPRRSRFVSLTVAVALVVVFTVVAVRIPRGGVTGWNTPDSVAMVVFAVAVAAFLLRYALVRATPTPRGLEVRNLIVSRHLEWAEIVNVQFGNGAPWLTLELSDTETLAVMAVQRSDGTFAEAEARRLAALVEVNNRTPGGAD
ncbi:PH domain-containing protein [Flexivirga caeni]|uniref:PH domain-containing protein n=1 Tax=Flexivirga caeni TaxID=2294115 RepID=A0A3M9LXX9_9MICO|nr:PH domain-containing protein [Flexivirga caeni]